MELVVLRESVLAERKPQIEVMPIRMTILAVGNRTRRLAYGALWRSRRRHHAQNIYGSPGYYSRFRRVQTVLQRGRGRILYRSHCHHHFM